MCPGAQAGGSLTWGKLGARSSGAGWEVGGEAQLDFADVFWPQQGKRIGPVEMGPPVGDSSVLCRM